MGTPPSGPSSSGSSPVLAPPSAFASGLGNSWWEAIKAIFGQANPQVQAAFDQSNFERTNGTNAAVAGQLGLSLPPAFAFDQVNVASGEELASTILTVDQTAINLVTGNEGAVEGEGVNAIEESSNGGSKLAAGILDDGESLSGETAAESGAGEGAEGAATAPTGTELAQQLGQEGEVGANIVKNTERIDSITETADYRVPDILDHTNQIIGDVKMLRDRDLQGKFRTTCIMLSRTITTLS